MPDVDFLEFGPFINPLKQAAARYKSQPGQAGLAAILEQATELSQAWDQRGEDGTAFACRLEQGRESARRGSELRPEQVGLLFGIAEQIGEESYKDEYMLMELVQAAAVACAPLQMRNEGSLRLAIAAKRFTRWDRARYGYADLVEGMQIMARLFQVDLQQYAQVEDKYRQRWEQVRAQTGDARALFDADGRQTREADWTHMVEWGSDCGSNQGLIAQIDATLRLAIRQEHARDLKGETIAPTVEHMLAQWEAAIAQDETKRLEILRFMATVGDAAIEIGEWHLGASVFGRLLRHARDANHPITLHAVAQKALCHLMQGELPACHGQLQAYPRAQVELLSGSIATVAGEFARLLAVEHACRGSLGETTEGDIRERLRAPLRTVRLIASPEPTSRTEYLRALYVAVLFRDIEATLARC